MNTKVQEELFSPEQYTRRCAMCRGEYPRTQEFFARGKTKDGMATVCRKCAQSQVARKKDRAAAEIPSALEKWCAGCSRTKPLTEYFMDSRSPDGKSHLCKECANARYQAAEERKKRLGPDSWAVYFIQDSRNLRVKFDCGTDPYNSVNELQQGSSVPLRLLAFIEAGAQEEAEARVGELQNQFQTLHAGNDWFECETSLQQYISLLQQTTAGAQVVSQPMPPLRSKLRRNRRPPLQAVRVEGQLFPDLAAAANATGFSTEQIESLGSHAE